MYESLKREILASLVDLLLSTFRLWYLSYGYIYLQLLCQLILCLRALPVVQEAARSMMDGIGENGLVIDGRKLFFEYRCPFFKEKDNFHIRSLTCKS